MKKSLLASTLIVLLSVIPCFAISFSKAIVLPSNSAYESNTLKAWEDEWMMAEGDTVKIDINLSDVPEPLISAAILVEFDPSQMSIDSADFKDGWDTNMSNTVKEPTGPGSYMFTAGNLSNVNPDDDGDIGLASIQFECVDTCDGVITVKTVPRFDSVVGNSAVVYDSDISPNYFNIDPKTTSTTTTKDYICVPETIYGEHSAETELLRHLRDNVLSKSQEGQELIKLYYQWSPVIVRAMEADEDFKQEVKEMVDEVLGVIE